MKLTMLLTVPMATLLAIGACNSDETTESSSTTGTTTGTGGGTTVPEPEVHRAAPETCTGMPPMGNPLTDPGGDCLQDGDCASGTNGRCIWPYGGNNVCMYDECGQDADCGGASTCACRIDEAFGMNRCFLGNCQVDADCPGSYCSPSAVHVSPSCMTGIAPGSIGFFCHTPQDGCIDDSECGAPETTACIFDVDEMRWACQELACTL